MKKRLSSFQIIIISFLAVIAVGSLLLMLPFATKDPGGASVSDALFTATSSVCVTGLIVQDTAVYWSVAGRAVILLLIQIGGMGVITVAASVTMLAGRKIGLMQRSTLQNAVSAPDLGGIVKLTGFIVKGVLLVEGIGAACLAPFFCREYGFWSGIGRAVFHSVSAFCNAGFDCMGQADAPFASLTRYAGHPAVNAVIMLLIVVGGLGFVTWHDIKTYGWHLRRYRLQSKVIFVVTAGLIVLPALFFYCYELSGEAFSSMSAGEKVLAALFQSVTLRTAGFNTIDLTQISGPGQAIMIVCMLIGGAPGSTAGGLKVTTFAVLLLSAFSVFRRRDNVTCFGRRLPDSIVKNAAAIVFLYLLLFFTGGVIISCVEGLPLSACLFETASAVGTVGLTLGITTKLCLFSKLILILLMFFGRVGGLTLIFAAVSGVRTYGSKLPQDKIMVG